jgi:hypothetical protein
VGPANLSNLQAGVAAEGSSNVGSDIARAYGIRPTRTENRRRAANGSARGVSTGSNSSSALASATAGRYGELTREGVEPASRHRSSAMARSTISTSSNNRARGYAQNFLFRYDEDKNGNLGSSEWSRIHPNWGELDRNGDSKLDVDEIAVCFDACIEQEKLDDREGLTSSRETPLDAVRLTSISARKTPDSALRTPDVAPTLASPNRSPEPRPGHHRFLYFAYERIVAGMPPWFIEKDRDKDGQVMMYEYADEWTDAKVGDYRQYDLNDDGIITPAEIRTLAKPD